MKAPEFAVYVHIPYCISRCPYCDFNTYVGIEDTAPEYVDALLVEAKTWTERAAGRPTGSIFLGGGTPSLLEPALLERLMRGLHETFEIEPSAEITMEANPETVDADRLAAYHASGVNRISFGAQSFATHVLQTLGRAHDGNRTKAAMTAARASGFNNVNLDLIYGTPGESFDDWRRSLDETIALAPEHISAYALTIEAGTAFGAAVSSGAMLAPDDDDMAAKYEYALDALHAAGYEHYEISNWARPGRACRHNLVYWTQGDYAGLGAGAHGHHNGTRSWNHKLPRTYIDNAADPVAGSETLSLAERLDEWLVLRARLVGGLDRAEAESHTGRDLSASIGRLITAGLVVQANGLVVPTRRGLLLGSEIALALTA